MAIWLRRPVQEKVATVWLSGCFQGISNFHHRISKFRFPWFLSFPDFQPFLDHIHQRTCTISQFTHCSGLRPRKGHVSLCSFVVCSELWVVSTWTLSFSGINLFFYMSLLFFLSMSNERPPRAWPPSRRVDWKRLIHSSREALQQSTALRKFSKLFSDIVRSNYYSYLGINTQ